MRPLALVAAALVISGCVRVEGSSVEPRPPHYGGDSALEATCAAGAAVYAGFFDGCADRCYAFGVDHACTEALTDDCDCGPDSCWDGQGCLPAL